MLLGLHTYSLYLHGIGQAWAGFELPWERQLSTFQLFDLALSWDWTDFIWMTAFWKTWSPLFSRKSVPQQKKKTSTLSIICPLIWDILALVYSMI